MQSAQDNVLSCLLFTLMYTVIIYNQFHDFKVAYGVGPFSW